MCCLHSQISVAQIPSTLSPDGVDFLNSLLAKIPSQRLTLGHALDHTWLHTAVGSRPLALLDDQPKRPTREEIKRAFSAKGSFRLNSPPGSPTSYRAPVASASKQHAHSCLCM